MASAAFKIEPVEEVPLEREALDDAGGDMVAAVELLTRRIMAEPRVVGEDQLGSWARAWAYERVHSLVRRDRQSSLRPVVANDTFGQSLQGAMQAELTRMMDTPIFGGKKLRDATVEEVRESARRYALLAEDTGRKARWQNAVADVAEKKKGKTIGSALTEKVLVELWDKSDV